jgi:hypothetical protein
MRNAFGADCHRLEAHPRGTDSVKLNLNNQMRLGHTFMMRNVDALRMQGDFDVGETGTTPFITPSHASYADKTTDKSPSAKESKKKMLEAEKR